MHVGVHTVYVYVNVHTLIFLLPFPLNVTIMYCDVASMVYCDEFQGSTPRIGVSFGKRDEQL